MNQADTAMRATEDSEMALPVKRRFGSLYAPMIAMLGLLASATAVACTGQHNAGGPVDLVIDAWDDVEQDRMISRWQSGVGANAQFLTGCSSLAAVPMDVTSLLPGLEFVRNVTVDGKTYPAFGLIAYPRSPLLIFRHRIWTGEGVIKEDAVPLDVSGKVHFPSKPLDSTGRGSQISAAVISRGGVMEQVPSMSLGSIARQSPLYPAFVKTDTFTFSATIRPKTCTLADAPVTLDDVVALDLPAAGSTAGDRDFNVRLNCNGEFPVSLQLTDANAPGNTGSRLVPSTNATAVGVHVQLLREGAPVVLGQTWSIPQSRIGDQNIALSARYHREAGTFAAGVVEGQAIITATYR
ncbi:MAG: type 1 fimbrial protein [Stenotrophomonas sp.]|jgi:type 1 fimbria pilin|uniref:fimbrial protein n=1 Tax=Stenotrophomonas sp. TaxID=69392 RepID=UPI00284F9449|nr:fimbrial protein [Stenotrophomonas sp.]MDR2957925.1 type 1 fimbrial protein [Stenotrophomonas sp.]